MSPCDPVLMIGLGRSIASICILYFCVCIFVDHLAMDINQRDGEAAAVGHLIIFFHDCMALSPQMLLLILTRQSGPFGV